MIILKEVFKSIQILNNGTAKYRLGDAILLQNGAALSEKGVTNEQYKNTIGYDYCKATSACADIELVNKLIDTHIEKNNYVLAEDELVIHLRIGENKFGPHGNRKDPSKSKTIDSEDEVNKLVDLVDDTFKDVVIVTAMHQVKDPSNDMYKSFEMLYNKLQKKGFNVSVKSSASVDEDFCYISKAKNFIPTHGNFSVLAGLCNTNNVKWDICERDIMILGGETQKYYERHIQQTHNG